MLCSNMNLHRRQYNLNATSELVKKIRKSPFQSHDLVAFEYDGGFRVGKTPRIVKDPDHVGLVMLREWVSSSDCIELAVYILEVGSIG